VAARRAVLSPALRARGQTADQRLHHRWTTTAARKKEPSVIAVAVARELAGWCWSLATMNGQPMPPCRYTRQRASIAAGGTTTGKGSRRNERRAHYENPGPRSGMPGDARFLHSGPFPTNPPSCR
jgi:hypothetical protein